MDKTIAEIFLGVMDLQEAKNHQIKLKNKGILLELKSNGETCTTGCKVTVELWGRESDQDHLKDYFKNQYLKNVEGHTPNFEHMSEVFDANAAEVICQACGTKFSPKLSECPDCGLVYS